MDMREIKAKKKKRKPRESIRCWKLKESERQEFVETIVEQWDKPGRMWNNTYDRRMEIAKDKLRILIGRKYLKKNHGGRIQRSRRK